jgi:hypothetical protein
MFANKVRKNVAIFIGDSISFRENTLCEGFTEPINILIACKADDAKILNKNHNPKQFYAFKHYIHIYGNGVFQCAPNVDAGTGSLLSTPEDFYEFLGDKEPNVQLLIQYFYKSKKAIARGCGYVPIEAIMNHIEENHLNPKIKETITGRKDCKLSKMPNDCYDEEFENYFSIIIREEDEKEQLEKDARRAKQEMEAKLKNAEEEDEPYEYDGDGGKRKRKTRKEKNRSNCIRLYTRSNNVLKKRWTKNHCRKTSKRLICKISQPSKLPCDDKKLSYYNYARWPIRSFRNSHK